jgi:nucleotide-binding universal stress UspA family protein
MDSANKVLVAIDFSPCSGAALLKAARLAAWKNASLTALHIVASPETYPWTPVTLPNMAFVFPTADQLAADARRRWPAFAKQYGASAETRIVIESGNPRDRILETVRQLKPALLVIGAHSTADAARGIGTTATACAQWASAPVMVVREQHKGPFRSVVACVDFSDTSRLALEQAIAIAAEDGAVLNILHVYSDPWHGAAIPKDITRNMPDFADRYRHAIEERLRTFCEPLKHELDAIKPEFHGLQSAKHADGIMAFMERRGCDLAVLGTRAQWTMRDYLWGSTAERVVREAACSVLTIKPPSFTGIEQYQPLADSEAVISAAM